MLKKNWRHIYISLVVFTDFVIFNFSFYYALHFLYSDIIEFKDIWDKWLFVCLIFFPLSLSVGMYRGIFQLSLQNQLPHIKKFSFYLALITMSYMFLVKTEQDTRFMIIIFLIMQYLLLTLNHSILNKLNRILLHKGYNRKNTLIIGNDISALNFKDHLRNIFEDYYHVKGFVSYGSKIVDPVLNEYLLGTYKDIDYIIRENDIQQVFIISKSMSIKKYNYIRMVCEKFNINAKMVSPFVRNLLKQVKIKDVTGVFLTVNSKSKKNKKWNLIFKTIFDKLFVLIAAIIILPFGLFFALLIKITSKGPVFFKQERALHRNSPIFISYKFRIRYKNNFSDYPFIKKENNEFTPVGKFLHKYNLDEIPQLINVLKNEMSIVGPRPLPLEEFKMIENESLNYDWYIRRGEVKPGITGLWQVSARNDLSFEEMCLLDLYYIENYSFFLDLEILFDTIPAMFLSRNVN